MLTLLMTVGEPQQITALITPSISSNSEKRQHTKTRARTSVSREPVDVVVSCSIERHFYLMLIWADSAYPTNTNIGAAQFGADVRKYECGPRSDQNEHRHEANRTGIQTVRRKNIKQYHHSLLLSIE